MIACGCRLLLLVCGRCLNLLMVSDRCLSILHGPVAVVDTCMESCAVPASWSEMYRSSVPENLLLLAAIMEIRVRLSKATALVSSFRKVSCPDCQLQSIQAKRDILWSPFPWSRLNAGYLARRYGGLAGRRRQRRR